MHSKQACRSLRRVVCLAAGVAVIAAGPDLLRAGEQTPKRPEAFELGYLSADAKGFFACRPSVWFKEPGMEKASHKLDETIAALKMAGIEWPKGLRPEHIEQIVADVNITTHKNVGKPRSRSLMIGASNIFLRMDRDFDWFACFENVLSQVKRLLAGQEDLCKKCFATTGKAEVDGVMIYRLGVVPMFGGVQLCAHRPDRRSVLVSFLPPKDGDAEFVRLLRAAPAARKRNWGSGLSKLEGAALAVVLDNHEGYYAKTYAKDLDKADVHLLERIRFAAVGVELGKGKPVRAVVEANSAEAAPVLEKAIYQYGHRALDGICEAKHKDNTDKVWIKLVTELVSSGQVHCSGAQIEWLGFSSIVLRDLIDSVPGNVSGGNPK